LSGATAGLVFTVAPDGSSGTNIVAHTGSGYTGAVVVGSGATWDVVSGQVDSGDTVLAGGIEQLDGGTGKGTDVASNGLMLVGSGGIASGTLLNAGAHLILEPHGSAVGTTGGGTIISSGVVERANATAPLSAFATSASGLMLSSGSMFVLPGGK